jgi:hypothetical protein
MKNPEDTFCSARCETKYGRKATILDPLTGNSHAVEMFCADQYALPLRLDTG